MKEKNINNVTEEYIDALYYHCMWSSDACRKNDPTNVTQELKKLHSQSAKYNTIKENNMIRVKGFSWDQFKHAWSKNGKKYSVFELAKHLQLIIKAEK